ncbi:MAG: hypothetical protein DDT42_01652 [candidate division WS2 bacterium]|uniref:DNA polymerase III delta N-terminal domain-containing protein n=1 Tax=Psychracetigena formicireducens TaxID=2986056 RepID=A0A9E2BHN9_PSYF1|nr:hypothetical protein [Candidatus Psychracetigena formicireducens]
MATKTAQASASSILKEVKQNKFQPVYFLFGEEPFFIDQITNAIEKYALPAEAKSFNQVVLYGKDCNIGAIINNARRFPMMAERVVVIIKEAHSLPDWKNSEATNTLEKYLKSPQTSTVLVFAFKNKSFDKRVKIAKVLEEYTVFFESKKISDAKLDSFVQDQLAELNLKAENNAIQLLTENIGNDPSRIKSELDKLAINLKERRLLLTIFINLLVSLVNTTSLNYKKLWFSAILSSAIRLFNTSLKMAKLVIL